MADEEGNAGAAGSDQGSEGSDDTISTVDTSTTPPAPMVGEDGVFTDGWQSQLDESIRGDASLTKYKNVKEMAKGLVNAQRMIGKNKIAVPGETSTDSEWEAFHVAGGRPETAGDYNLQRPEALAEELYSTDMASAFQDLAHKMGLSQKQVDAIFEFNNTNIVSGLELQATNAENTLQELKDGLVKQWGGAYDQKIELGNLAIEQGVDGDEDFKARLTSKMGNDPDFIRFASTLGSKFSEHGVKGEAIPTPLEYDQKMDEMMHSDAYTNRRHPQHKAIVNSVFALRQRKLEGLARKV